MASSGGWLRSPSERPAGSHACARACRLHFLAHEDPVGPRPRLSRRRARAGWPLPCRCRFLRSRTYAMLQASPSNCGGPGDNAATQIRFQPTDGRTLVHGFASYGRYQFSTFMKQPKTRLESNQNRQNETSNKLLNGVRYIIWQMSKLYQTVETCLQNNKMTSSALPVMRIANFLLHFGSFDFLQFLFLPTLVGNIPLCRRSALQKA